MTVGHVLPGNLSDPAVPYVEAGQTVLVLLGWRGRGPHNVLIERTDGTRVVRPFRGLTRPQ